MSSDAIFHGRVKWFDIKKGYGFIVSPSLPNDDIFFHASIVQKQYVGAAVTFTLGYMPDGRKRATTLAFNEIVVIPLPKECSHRFAAMDLLTGAVMVTNSIEEMQAWVTVRRRVV